MDGPRTSNLSQQQQKKFWSKMIFEQQNQKNFPENIFFKKKKNSEKFISQILFFTNFF